MRTWITLACLLANSISVASSADFRLDLSKSAHSLKINEQGVISLSIFTTKGAHINGEAPIEVTFEDSDGLKLSKNKLAREDLQNNKDEPPFFRVSIVADKVGKLQLKGNIRFFLCSPTSCQRISENFSHHINVENQLNSQP